MNDFRLQDIVYAQIVSLICTISKTFLKFSPKILETF